MKYTMITIAALVFISAAACERVDKAFEAVDKAKSLKTEVGKTASEMKRDITGKTEALAEKSAEKLVGLSDRDKKRPEGKEKSQKEENGKNEREHKNEKD